VGLFARQPESRASVYMSELTSLQPLLSARDLVHEYRVGARFGGGVQFVPALSGVSFDIRQGEVLGLIGESGSGKSTVARALLQCPPPKSGTVLFQGSDLTRVHGNALRAHRRHIQMIFQDPFGSLDPKWRVRQIVEEPLLGFGLGTRTSRRNKVDQVLQQVGLPSVRYGRRRPNELSGGQCQRVAIPRLIVCDEAVSSLDVLVQSQILGLLLRLRREFALSYLFISHDLNVVWQVCDRVAVLRQGQLCEIGPIESVYRQPGHPYTAALVRSALAIRRGAEQTDLPAVESPSSTVISRGCQFRNQCPQAQGTCESQVPRLVPVGRDHMAACHFPMSVRSPATSISLTT
jgi:oligopeptide/dipeptide ABC transporter ATP-binding protein